MKYLILTGLAFSLALGLVTSLTEKTTKELTIHQRLINAACYVKEGEYINIAPTDMCLMIAKGK